MLRVKNPPGGIGKLVRTTSIDEQIRLREHLPQGDQYYPALFRICLQNPFFHLTEEEEQFFREAPNASHLRKLVVARAAASRSTAPKYAVFCMPKSGSTFVKSALKAALDLPSVSLTGFSTAGGNSYFGMNSREQELDELALLKSIFDSEDGFVSQVHTRYSAFLARQILYFRMTPLVLLRNILDCIVSYDDMMMAGRAPDDKMAWLGDSQFYLPSNYAQLEPRDRYDLLARSFGVWLVGFFLSWKRCERQDLIKPLTLRYETDILNVDRFVEILASRLALTSEQTGKLRSYAWNPDRRQVRFNVGVSGRGRDRIGDATRDGLISYARMFSDEISPDDLDYLFG